LQTVVNRFIGNLRAKFNNSFAKIMPRIVAIKEGISAAKKKEGGN
jgi:hypothetical protein